MQAAVLTLVDQAASLRGAASASEAVLVLALALPPERLPARLAKELVLRRRALLLRTSAPMTAAAARVRATSERAVTPAMELTRKLCSNDNTVGGTIAKLVASTDRVNEYHQEKPDALKVSGFVVRPGLVLEHLVGPLGFQDRLPDEPIRTHPLGADVLVWRDLGHQCSRVLVV